MAPSSAVPPAAQLASAGAPSPAADDPRCAAPPLAPSIALRGVVLRWGQRTYVMAIVNVTPDSFSGDGVDRDVGAAVDAAARAVAAGADIVDIGGESTRPGAEAVSTGEETDRIVPAVIAVRARFAIPISVDTAKAAVAAAALDAGADMVNDVCGLQADPALGPLVASRGVPIVIMHNRSRRDQARFERRVGGHYVGVAYDDVVAEVSRDLAALVASARAAGIAGDRIIVDPGIGFGKTAAQNLALLDGTGAIRALGHPVLVGPSRKSFIGHTLDVAPDDRLEGTAASVAVAIARGADMVRVHDVRAMVRVARMTDAIVRRSA